MKKYLFYWMLILLSLSGNAQVKLSSIHKRNEIKFEHITVDHGLSNNSILCIIQDNKGFLWIGTSDGMNKYDGNNITNYFYNPDDPNSLSGNSIQTILEDNTGILWIGTREGLNKFDPKTEKFSVYKNDPQDPESLSHNNIRSIFEDSSGTLWIGTWGGGLNKFIPPAPDSLGNDSEGPDRFIHYENSPQDPESLSDNWVLTIFEDSSGRLWIGTVGGLNIFDRNAEKFTIYKNDPMDTKSLSPGSVKSILEDNSGNLWIGTEAGWLNKLDPKTEKFTGYKNDTKNPNSLSHNIVRSIFEDSSGTLWFGTVGGGLNKYIPSGSEEPDKFTNYTTKDGLPNNTIYDLLEDDKGNIWISTGKGVSRYNSKTEEFKNHSVLEDLFQDDEFHSPTAFKSKSGEMFFGGINGFITFFPDSISSRKDNSFIPPIVITEFNLFNKSVFPGEDSPLKKSITYTKEIKLNYKQNFLSFEFAALNFTNPEKNQYKYRMIGLDADTVYSGIRRFADYSEIRPGDYTFWVTGSNNDGIWNEEGTSIRIIIHPPLWKTNIAYALYIITVILGLYAFIKIRERKLQRDKNVLGTKVKERTAELEEKNIELKRYNRLFEGREIRIKELRDKVKELEKKLRS